MKLIAPDYYAGFSCLMGDCRHSCCAGWEIDVDDEALSRFRAVPGALGDRLRGSIDEDGDGARFRLTEDGRCPFLNGEGLCDLILSLGEDCLCQICADHPRFRNFFSDRTEIGLGLCCEAAGRLILSRREPVRLVELSDDGLEDPILPEEAALTGLRGRLIALAQDRSTTVEARASRLLQASGLAFDPDSRRWTAFFRSLERLDEDWTSRLDALDSTLPAPLPESEPWETAFEQLLVYLLYRHLPGALDDGDVSGRIAFAALIFRLLRDLCGADMARGGRNGLDGLVELARLYSSEIEYSDENLTALLDEIHRRSS